MASAWTRIVKSAALLACLLLATPVSRGVAAESRSDDGVRMGFSTAMFYDASLTDVKAAVMIWGRELSRDAGLAFQPSAQIYDDLDQLLEEVRSGALDLVALTPLDFLRSRAKALLEPSLVGLQLGKATDQYLLLVHNMSGIHTLEELRGKSLATLSSGGATTTLWLDTLLARDGLPRASDLLTVTRHGSRTSAVLLQVFFRGKDACVTTGNSYTTAGELNPQLGRDLVVLARSPKFPLGLMCLRGNLSPERKRRILASCLKVTSTPAGRQVMTLFKVEDVVPFVPGLLDELEALIQEHETLFGVARRAP